MSDQNKFFLKPGNSVQGDSNVRHPAGDILNIKGFYEQNSHVMPENLIECTGVLAHGVEDEWCEYVPASYDGTTAGVVGDITAWRWSKWLGAVLCDELDLCC
ncbi:MAG: hypothetical protein ACOX1U_03095 [Saccharofermentanales bacterium]|jgi:hypothetical protein